MPDRSPRWRRTTILAVRHGGRVALAGDGQVTLGAVVVKADAAKIRKLYDGKVLVGFAGSTADAFALLERFDSKLRDFGGNVPRAATELAKEWRTDRALRRLEAMLVAVDATHTLLLSGTGDVIAPSDGVLGIGSGGAYAEAAGRALVRHSSLSAGEIARESLKIAGDLCIYSNGNLTVEELPLFDLTPREIVAELDRHIVGQNDAKRAVAIALRNRWRRQQLPEEMRKEVTPKNIIMIGPTGVGKTEIARRLAALVKAPFCKVEATKYTEVGYHGRDVESVIRDLAEAAFRLVREEERIRVRPEAEKKAERRLLDLLLPGSDVDEEQSAAESPTEPSDETESPAAARKRARERLREKLAAGRMEDRTVTIQTEQRQSPVHVLSNMGMENMDTDLQGMLEKLMPKNARSRELPVREARKLLIEQETEGLIDRDAVSERAVRLAEESGVVFIDEIDKVSGPGASHGPDVSRQGVQRDLLPIVEGTTVQTRYGAVRTEHVLFIAAGAFHISKPSDLMPELQGRFPIRVELKDLDHADFVRILREPKNSLIRQYTALLGAEGFTLTFSDDALEAMAEIAHRVNKSTDNIGARRLYTILEKLLEEPSFDAPDVKHKQLHIDAEYVRRKLESISANQDLSKFIL